MTSLKNPIHGRNHRYGGSDPIGFLTVETAVVSVAMGTNNTFGTGGGAMSIDSDPFSLVSIASNVISILQAGSYLFFMRAEWSDSPTFLSTASTVVNAYLKYTGTPTLSSRLIDQAMSMRIKEVGVNVMHFKSNFADFNDIQSGDLPVTIAPFSEFESGTAISAGGTHNVQVTVLRLSEAT